MVSLLFGMGSEIGLRKYLLSRQWNQVMEREVMAARQQKSLKVEMIIHLI